jgi:hypothetical protein
VQGESEAQVLGPEADVKMQIQMQIAYQSHLSWSVGQMLVSGRSLRNDAILAIIAAIYRAERRATRELLGEK